MPGYHGKGLYSGQGQLIYANNGEHGEQALKNPETPSGVLASWNGSDDKWTMVRRNQFTEVTGPAGIYELSQGKADDPIWSIGWDHRSLILMCLHQGKWSTYRLPKASHSYDGAHGWNTEWPRIRDIGEQDLLMTMHGMFWRFPRGFDPQQSTGIAPRSSYLKVVGDFCRWQDRIVLGCDDTAKSEFLNKRKAKGEIAAPQSQSNLWFLRPEQLDTLGPVYGRGAVWLTDDCEAGALSDPFCFKASGAALCTWLIVRIKPLRCKLKSMCMEPTNGSCCRNGRWRPAVISGSTSVMHRLLPGSPEVPSRWTSGNCLVRLQQSRHAFEECIRFAARDGADGRWTNHFERCDGRYCTRAWWQQTHAAFCGRTLPRLEKELVGLYELDGALSLRPDTDVAALKYEQEHAALPTGVLSQDEASLIYVDDAGRRWRLPRFDKSYSLERQPPARVCREVATERDLFNAGGTFYELPAENAGGFAKVRAVATHGSQIIDYCSYRGMLVMSGVVDNTQVANSHLIRSEDKRAALWVGAVDDVWKFGKPRGVGGPWKNTQVKAGEVSDAYLMSGFDQKSLSLSHDASDAVVFTVECDVSGTGLWLPWKQIEIAAKSSVHVEFPEAFSLIGCGSRLIKLAWLVVSLCTSEDPTKKLSDKKISVTQCLVSVFSRALTDRLAAVLLALAT